MKRIIYAVPFLFLGYLLLLSYSSGAPTGYTGSPGDNGNTCRACHSGGAAVTPTVTLTGIPAQGYTPGQTYTLTLDVSGVNNPRTGFEGCVENASHQKTGTLSNTDSNTQALSGGQYITHTSQGNSLHQWSFNWQAPSVDQGDLTFYCAVNITNGNNSTSGDYVLTTNFAIPSAGTVVRKFSNDELRIFPNPAQDFLHFDTRMHIRQVYAVSLDGKRIALPLRHQKADLRQLRAGQYILHIQTDEGTGTKNLIKR